MTYRVDALSMSWRAARAARENGWSGEVLAVHPRSCYVAGEDGEIYAVVQEPLGNGPLNIVIPSSPKEPFQGLLVGTPVTGTGDRLAFGDALEVGLERALLWDPKGYPGLEADADGLSRSLAEAYRAATALGPERSLARLLPYLGDEDLPEPLRAVGHFPRSHALIAGLVEALARRSRRSLKVVTSSLAGLGPGLTPAGDDFLAGILLALALSQERRPDAELAEIASLLLETAAPRTHEISAAYLRAAHAGEAGERWHPLIDAVARAHTGAVAGAVRAVMTIGETSGADMLAGFLAGMSAIYNVTPGPWQGSMLPAVNSQPPTEMPPPTA